MSLTKLLLVISFIAFAPSAVAAIPDPDSIPAVLMKGSEQDASALAKSLGMTVPKEWIGRATQDELCGDFDSVTLDRPTLYGGSQVVLVAHAPSLCAMAFVVILDKANGQWRVVDTLRFREHHVTPHVSYEKLISIEHSELVVTNIEIDYGTGIENIRMMVFDVSQSGARQIFDEPSELAWAVPSSHMQDLTDQTETDEYSFVSNKDDSGKLTGTKYIHRVEKIKDNDKEVTRNWDYDWSQVYKKLVGYQTSD